MTVVRIGPGPITGRASVPASKSYTHRALVAGALTGRSHRIHNPLVSDDTEATATGLGHLGHPVRVARSRWTIGPGNGGTTGRITRIECRESGTTLRLLSAVAALSDRPTRFEGRARLRRRPIAGLIDALVARGVQLQPPGRPPRLPYTLRGPIRGGPVEVPVDQTSQFASALLFALPAVEADSWLRLNGRPVSQPYLDATVRVLHEYGVRVLRRGNRFRIPGRQRYRRAEFTVPADASSAAYLWTGAAISTGRVRIEGFDRRWPQADLAILGILREAGAEVRVGSRSIEVGGPARYPIDVDLTDAPDLVPLVAVLAATIPGVSRIGGTAHARLKESDRVAAAVDLVRALGGRATVRGGAIRIEGRATPRPIHRRGLRDHRVIMAAAVGALRSGGTSELGDSGAVGKSYPGFWGALDLLGARIREAP